MVTRSYYVNCMFIPSYEYERMCPTIVDMFGLVFIDHKGHGSVAFAKSFALLAQKVVLDAKHNF